MEKNFRLNDEDMHKPLTMEQMTQMFSQEDKDAVNAINQELHKSKYNSSHLKKDWRKLAEKKWGKLCSETTEEGIEADNSAMPIDEELNELYKQYGQNKFELERLQHEQEAIFDRINILRNQK
jgi:chromosome segregation and condensation protein ScpB